MKLIEYIKNNYKTGDKLWSPAYGDLILQKINDSCDYMTFKEELLNATITFDANGKLSDLGQVMIFPNSKDEWPDLDELTVETLQHYYEDIESGEQYYIDGEPYMVSDSIKVEGNDKLNIRYHLIPVIEGRANVTANGIAFENEFRATLRFNPYTLYHYDKVLVKRNGLGWMPTMYAGYKNKLFITTDGAQTSHIIPYNDETEAFIGETEINNDFYDL